MDDKNINDFRNFSGSITENGDRITFSVCEEVINKYRQGYSIIRFLIKGVHPQHGPFSFFIKQDEDGDFVREYCPTFLSPRFIKQLRLLIEHHAN